MASVRELTITVKLTRIDGPPQDPDLLKEVLIEEMDGMLVEADDFSYQVSEVA